MDSDSQKTSLAYSRSHMANERTHLAYLRTSLSLLSFGVTLNRFSLYLKKSDMSPHRLHGFLSQTEIVGLGIVYLGIVILCWALYRYRKVTKAIDQHTYKPPSLAISILTSGILFLGGLVVAWMMIDWR